MTGIGADRVSCWAMSPIDPRDLAAPATPAAETGFQSTCWSLVLAAGDRGAPRADEAMAALCATYWYPVYAFVRRRGHDADAASDLTQAFFARLLEKGDLRAADRERGRFRTFLLVVCKRFLANEHDRATAAKRGGGRVIASFDARDAEGRYHREPIHDLTPEAIFERRWASTLLDAVFDRIRGEFDRAGKAEQFEALKATLTGDSQARPYAEVAERLGMTEGAVQAAAHRLRKRFREEVRAAVAETLDDPADLDDEIRDLFAALAV